MVRYQRNVVNRLLLVLASVVSFFTVEIDTDNFTNGRYGIFSYVFAIINTILIMRGLADIYLVFKERKNTESFNENILRNTLISGLSLFIAGLFMRLVASSVIRI